MSQENAKKFMELIKKDEGFQKKVRTAADAFTGDKKEMINP